MGPPHNQQDKTPLRAYWQCDEDGIIVICPQRCQNHERTAPVPALPQLLLDEPRLTNRTFPRTLPRVS